MTKVLSDLEDEAGSEKEMTYRNREKQSGSGEQHPVDPLGSNSEIGRKLRQYYDDLVSDQVPDRFSQLLAELEKHETPDSGTKED